MEFLLWESASSPKSHRLVYPSRARFKKRHTVLKVGHFSVYLHFPHGEPQMQGSIKCCACFPFQSDGSPLRWQLIIFRPWDSLCRAGGWVFIYLSFILICIASVKQDGEGRAQAPFPHKLPRGGNYTERKSSLSLSLKTCLYFYVKNGKQNKSNLKPIYSFEPSVKAMRQIATGRSLKAVPSPQCPS